MEGGYPPRIGDLVSLELHAMEPVITNAGPQPPPNHYVRGRLGGMIDGKTLHPELESAVLEMPGGRCGSSRCISASTIPSRPTGASAGSFG
jgi:hypothetical protein